MMTVADLIAELEELPEDTIIVCARDSEGNLFSPLSETKVMQYDEETSIYGNVIDDGDGDYVTDEELEDRERLPSALVLWPTA